MLFQTFNFWPQVISNWADSLKSKLAMNTEAKGCILHKNWNKSFTDGIVYFGQAKCWKMAKFWMSQVAQLVHAKYYYHWYMITQTKVTYQNIWIKISKKGWYWLQNHTSQKFYFASCCCYDTKHTMENHCHTFYQFSIHETFKHLCK